MTDTRRTPRSIAARAGFWRLIGYLAVGGVVTVAAALYYLSTYGPLTPTLVITVTAGVFVSIMLGGGLMATVFFSSNSGHDDAVGDWRAPRDK